MTWSLQHKDMREGCVCVCACPVMPFKQLWKWVEKCLLCISWRGNGRGQDDEWPGISTCCRRCFAEASVTVTLEIQQGLRQLASSEPAQRGRTPWSKEKAGSTPSGVLLHICHQLFETLTSHLLNSGMFNTDRNPITTHSRVVSWGHLIRAIGFQKMTDKPRQMQKHAHSLGWNVRDGPLDLSFFFFFF